jgi:peptide/nickel transport system substrate-binding protein
MKRRNLATAPMLVFLVASIFLSACGSAATPAPAATSAPAAAAPTAAPLGTAVPTAEPIAEPETASGDKSGGRLVLVGNDDSSQLDPFISTWHSTAIYSVFDTLISYSPDFTTFEPLLAESWTVSEDNLQVTFKLREDVIFQDGTPLNAEAVKWNLDRYSDPVVASSQSATLNGLLTSTEVVDEYSVTLTLSEAYAPLFEFLSGLEIVSPTAYEAAGSDKFNLNPVGAGRWIVKENIPNEHILFDRYNDYNWGVNFVDNQGASYPAEFEIKSVADEATIYAMLETGEAHIAGIPSQFIDKARANENIEIVQGVNSGLDYLGFNNEHPILKDPALRRAIARAINRDEIVIAGYDGAADPIYGPLSPTEFGYSERVENIAREQTYDPDLAASMLAEAGWTDSDGDGILDKDGEKLEFRFIFPASDTYKRMAETVQAQLSDVGIKLNLEAQEESALKAETVAGTHEVFLLYFGLIDPRILCYIFCSDRIGGTNRPRYSNPDLDVLLKAADTEVDPEARKLKVEAVMELLVQERPTIPLLASYSFTGYRKDKVAGIKTNSIGGVLLDDVYLLDK